MKKYALITGGSRGIGRAICLNLADMGYNILINYRSNSDEAGKTLEMLRKKNKIGELYQFDVTDSEQVDTVLAEWEDSHPDEYIEVLVNNAGISKDILFMLMKDSDWQDVIGTTLNGFFYITRRLVKNMLANKFGRIINIASLSGQKGLAGQANYSAAKAGLIGVTKALAQEVGRKKVTVNAVAPGFIETEMTENLDVNILKKLIPLNRFGTPEEVAEVVGFLASEKSSYITGEVISVNGGLYT